MSWAKKKKSYQPKSKSKPKSKKFRPRQRTEEEEEYQRKIAKAREEAKEHALKLESERKAKQLELAKQEKLRAELQEIERKQAIIREEEEEIKKYFAEQGKLWKHRLALRTLNQSKNKSYNKNKKNLETKIKKITAFLNKTKQFEKHSKNVKALIKEMNKLKLGPYLDEIIKNLTNLNSESQVKVLLHLVSAIHQRFENSKFIKPFKDEILDAFRPKLDLLNENVRKRQELNLLILIEMQYLGLDTKNTLYELIKHIIRIETKHKEKLYQNIEIEKNIIENDDSNYKMEDNKNKIEITKMIYDYDDVMIHTLNLIAKFLKHTNEELFNSYITKYQNKKFNPYTSHHIFNDKQRKQISDLILNYFKQISRKYCQLSLKLKKQLHTNNIILIERGSVSDNRKEITFKLENVVEKMKENLKLFVFYLPNMLSFPEELPFDENEKQLNIDGTLTTLSDAQSKSFFDDKVSQSFYENLPLLKDNIPGSLLQGDKTEKIEMGASDENMDINDVNIDEIPSYLSADVSTEAEEISVETKSTMKELLNLLQCIGSRTETEILAEKFCYLNSKNNRKYLAQVLSSVGSNNNEITRLPFYCRFIAILDLSNINIGDRVCLSVEKEFYRLFLSKKHTFIKMDYKQLNLSYIAELTKFGIFPHNSVFNILEKLSKKFSNESIELLSFFMFQCGRYLYKNPLTHVRLNKILKYLRQRQTRTNLDTFLNQHINNAIYACKPPEKSALDSMQMNLTNVQKYIEYLLYFQLNHTNKQIILRKLRKMAWDKEENKQFITDRLFNISIVNFDKIDCIAAIIQGLNCYHSISNIIVDNVCEEIRIGLKEEDFTQEQRRLSFVKFLGELYTYKAVNSQVIMDTLYLFITYNIAVDNSANYLMNEEIINFRICLCCMLLEVCGKYLRKGKLKSRCDRFLLYFQRFIVIHSPIPFDIEWWINDVFAFVAPKMPRFNDLHLILDKIKAMENTNAQHKDALLVLEEEFEDEEDFEEDLENEEEFEEESVIDISEESSDDTADVNSYHRKKKITKEDKEFIDEYDKMMEQYRRAETNSKKTSINNLKHASVLANDYLSGKAQSGSDGGEEVAFKLLSKKGVNSTKLRIGTIKIPKQVMESMKLSQKKEDRNQGLDVVRSVTLQHLQSYENENEFENEFEGDGYGAEESGKGRRKVRKEYSKSAKQKYRQGMKQMQHQQIESEKEKQKTQRDEKRKKQLKYGLFNGTQMNEK